jgi:hypothetical protein
MTVLGDLSKRLQTDLSDLARASIDPQFSRSLTAANFQDKQLEKQRERQLEDQATSRRQQLQDEDRKIKLQSQLYATGIAVEQGRQSGDWTGLKNMVDSGNIDPTIAPELEMLANAGIPQGLDWALKQGDALIKARNATVAEQRNMIAQKGLDERTRNNIRTMFLRKQELNFNRAQAELDTAIAEDNADVVKNFFDTSPMLTEAERAGWQKAVEGDVSGAQAINVMNKFLDEQRALGVQEARNIAKANKSPDDFKLFKNVRDDYQGNSKPLRDELQTVADIENLLGQEQNASTNAALTNKVSSLFSGQLRAQAELNRWKNVGNLGQRIGNAFDQFFTGTRTQSSLEGIRQTVSNYKADLIRAHNREKARAYDNLMEFGEGRQDPNQLFPDASERFKERVGADGKTYIGDMWLNTVREKRPDE